MHNLGEHFGKFEGEGTVFGSIKKPFSEVEVKFEELLSQSGRAFLIGAGCNTSTRFKI